MTTIRLIKRENEQEAEVSAQRLLNSLYDPMRDHFKPTTTDVPSVYDLGHSPPKERYVAGYSDVFGVGYALIEPPMSLEVAHSEAYYLVYSSFTPAFSFEDDLRYTYSSATTDSLIVGINRMIKCNAFGIMKMSKLKILWEQGALTGEQYARLKGISSRCDSVLNVTLPWVPVKD